MTKKFVFFMIALGAVSSFASGFLKITDSGSGSGIEVAHKTYERAWDGKKVHALAMLHMGSPEFFQAINERLEAGQTVLFECNDCHPPLQAKIENNLGQFLSADEFKLWKLSQWLKSNHFNEAYAMSQAFGLARQPDALDYAKDGVNFIHADSIEPRIINYLETLLRSFQDPNKGSQMAKLALDSAKSGSKKYAANTGHVLESENTEYLSAFLESALAKEGQTYIDQLLPNFGSLKNALRTLLGEKDPDTSDLTERNNIVKNKISEHLFEDPETNSIWILYGAAHFAGENGIEKFLLDNNFELTDEEWLTAIPL